MFELLVGIGAAIVGFTFRILWEIALMVIRGLWWLLTTAWEIIEDTYTGWKYRPRISERRPAKKPSLRVLPGGRTDEPEKRPMMLVK